MSPRPASRRPLRPPPPRLPLRRSTRPPANTAATPDARPPPTKSSGWGTLKGQVVFGGAAPAVAILQEQGKAAKDPEVCAKDGPIKDERLLVDGATKGVKNVLIYFPKPSAVNDEAKSAKASAEVVFDQVKCVFEPHVLGMMVDTKVTLKSSDTVNHNINAKPPKNGPFNKLLAGGQTFTYEPTTGERAPAPVNCDIHPWMQAYWMILDNPYFAVTDEKGNFEIKNAPAGTQKVVVWQEAVGFVTAQVGEDVAINANDPTEKTWTIDPAKVKAAK